MKTHTELGITEEQYKNIAKLITFVREKVEPPKFDINTFYSEQGDPYEYLEFGEPKYECGSTACFCGYGPLAGIKPQSRESWWKYSFRAFGADIGRTHQNEIYSLLFDQCHENDKDSAVKRGAYFLQNGLPENICYYDLRKFEVPDNFRPAWAKIKKIAETI